MGKTGGFAVGNFRMIAVVFAALLSSNMLIGKASAMPADRLGFAANQAAAGTENVAWVCGYYGCRWRPDYYYYRGGPYYGPPAYPPPGAIATTTAAVHGA